MVIFFKLKTKVVQAMWKLLESEAGGWKLERQALPPIFNLGQFWAVVGPEELVLVGGEFCPGMIMGSFKYLKYKLSFFFFP